MLSLPAARTIVLDAGPPSPELVTACIRQKFFVVERLLEKEVLNSGGRRELPTGRRVRSGLGASGLRLTNQPCLAKETPAIDIGDCAFCLTTPAWFTGLIQSEDSQPNRFGGYSRRHATKHFPSTFHVNIIGLVLLVVRLRGGSKAICRCQRAIAGTRHAEFTLAQHKAFTDQMRRGESFYVKVEG
jgi:hypothetical protein